MVMIEIRGDVYLIECDRKAVCSDRFASPLTKCSFSRLTEARINVEEEEEEGRYGMCVKGI